MGKGGAKSTFAPVEQMIASTGRCTPSMVTMPSFVKAGRLSASLLRINSLKFWAEVLLVSESLSWASKFLQKDPSNFLRYSSLSVFSIWIEGTSDPNAPLPMVAMRLPLGSKSGSQLDECLTDSRNQKVEAFDLFLTTLKVFCFDPPLRSFWFPPRSASSCGSLSLERTPRSTQYLEKMWPGVLVPCSTLHIQVSLDSMSC
ncbi:hypothetical protein KCU61_g647, partial [Aureobasidium melanogenum]